jgi:hypothetical protein
MPTPWNQEEHWLDLTLMANGKPCYDSPMQHYYRRYTACCWRALASPAISVVFVWKQGLEKDRPYTEETNGHRVAPLERLGRNLKAGPPPPPTHPPRLLLPRRRRLTSSGKARRRPAAAGSCSAGFGSFSAGIRRSRSGRAARRWSLGGQGHAVVLGDAAWHMAEGAGGGRAGSIWARSGPSGRRRGRAAGGSAWSSSAQASRGGGPGDAVVTGLSAKILLGAEVASRPQIEGAALICWSLGLLRRTTVGGRLGWGAAAPARICRPWRRFATVQGRRPGGGLRVGDEVAAVVLGGCRQEMRWATCSRGGVEMFRAKALHRSCRCRQRWRPGVIFLLGDACRGASSTSSIVVALREKSQASGSGRAMAATMSFPS